jgi:hypothetical protein
LNNASLNYYLQYKKTAEGFRLYYEFDICEVLPQSVLKTINNKYGISYKDFYSHLQFLLQEMNVFLNKLGDKKSLAAATLICKACNKCFDTYREDINGFDENYSLSDLLQYQQTKDDDIIQVLLALRAVLLNKGQQKFRKQFSSWSSMVRSMQLYDDMQDVAQDCDFQMNVLCFFSRNYFKDEWHWLQKNKPALQLLKGMNLHSSIAFNMPASCIMAMQYARNIAYRELSWVQCKIQNYLWRKNWLGLNNPLLNENAFCVSELMNNQAATPLLQINFIKERVMRMQHTFISDDMKWAHIADIILMNVSLRTYLFKQISKRESYILKNCYIECPVQLKALLIKKIVSSS